MTGFVDPSVSITEESWEEERGVEPHTHSGVRTVFETGLAPGQIFFRFPDAVVGEGIEPPTQSSSGSRSTR